MKHGQEKSDLFIIALKPMNKPGRLGAELVEPRERTEGNMGEQHTYRTLCRIKRVPEARLCTRSCSWDPRGSTVYAKLLVGFVVNHPRWEPGA